jgi:hypothetical protein
MQSQKKHRMPKKERVNALEFAQGYLISCSASADTRQEAISKAVTNANNMALAALAKAKEGDGDAKELTATANFWTNIAGHLPKVTYK